MQNSVARPAIPCPNCRQQMQTRDLERHDSRAVQVDLCFACAGIWFDHLESVQLAPAAVIELFKEIHAQEDDARQPAAKHLGCPRCGETLAPSFDVCKSGRFSYFRCLRGDGRYTPFFQFLREKQFVRSLTPAEIERVRSQVRQIRCSQCGAPIDLEKSSECHYCQAPVSFLDPEAVEKAVQMWSEAEKRRHLGPTPQALGDALWQMQLRRADHPELTGLDFGGGISLAGLQSASGVELGLDLVSMGIHAIGRLFDKA
jgi:Zn-finger nucleic acid-binding protein